MVGGVGGDGGVFRSLDAADADAGENEPRQQRCPAGGVTGEAEVRESERGDSSGQNACGPPAVAGMSRGEAG